MYMEMVMNEIGLLLGRDNLACFFRLTISWLSVSVGADLSTSG